MTPGSKRIYEFGRFRLDVGERVLLQDGEPVSLGPKLVDTLVALVERAGHIVEKDELMNSVWPDSFVDEGSLTKNISMLRRVLSGESGVQLIENVPRRGYRFNGIVRELSGDRDALIITRRSRVTVASEDVSKIGLPALVRGVVSRGAGPRSLAVLPFNPFGLADSDRYLGLGIADALITRLSNVHEVIVRPTSAVVNYSSERDAAQMGRELRVDSVLEGTLQRSGDRMRVTVQLVSVEDGAPFWAEKFETQFTDVFAVEDSLSEQVVRAMSLRLTGNEQKLLTKHHTQNTEAHQAYLRGRYFWNARSGEWMQKALGYFQQAISLDPDYALAHAGLADYYHTVGFWGFVSPAASFPFGKAAANRALELDESLAEGHAALAWGVSHYDWDFARAEREYKRAIELNPGYVSARLWYAMFLALARRFDEAFAEIARAQEIDPLSLILNTDIGILLFLTRRYDEAIEQFQKTLELGPGYLLAIEFLGYTYGLKGMFEECLAWYQRLADGTGRSATQLARLAFGYAMAGDRTEALRLAAESKELRGNAYFGPHYYAQLYAMLGDRDQAFEWLERAFEERSPWIAWLGVNPGYDGLRADPRFADLLRRVGLPS